MNDHSHKPQIESEFEARIAALVLGEASDLEQDQLQRLIAERPELAELKAHFEAVHGLLRDIGMGECVATDDDWKLPTEKRNALIAVIDGESNSHLDKSSVPKALVFNPTPTRVFIKPRSLWKYSKIAAVFCVAGCLGMLMVSSHFFLQSKTASRAPQLARREFAPYQPSDFSTVIPNRGLVSPQNRVDTDVKLQLSAGQPAANFDTYSLQSSTSPLLAIRESLGGDKSLPSQYTLKDDVQSLPSGETTRQILDEYKNGDSESPASGPVAATESAGWELAKQNAQVQDGELAEAKEGTQNQWSAQASLQPSGGAAYRSTVNPKDEPTGGFGSGFDDNDMDGIADAIDLGMAGNGYGGEGNAEANGREWHRSAGHFPAEGEVLQTDAVHDMRVREPAQASRTSNELWAREDSKKLRELAVPNEANTARFGDSDMAVMKGDGASNLARTSVQATDANATEKMEALGELPSDRVVINHLGNREGQLIDLAEVESAERRLKHSQIFETKPGNGGQEQSVTEEVRMIDSYQSFFERSPELLKGGLSPQPSVPVNLNESNAADEAFSTFSLHVSDVSFKLAQAALAGGKWPEAAKLRIEEFVNAFDYGDPLPNPNEKVTCRVEQAIHPFLQQRNVLRVSLRTAATGRASNTPLRLTFLLDNSGSMERADRQQTVRRCFALLARQLTPLDQITLISFARQPRLLADKVSGDKAQQLVGLIEDLPSEGGTNIESALQLAFEKAREQQTEGAQSRIILLTDGAVNLGDADPESLSHMITTIRDTGIAFDAAGISADGLNDEILEALTRQGDGRYYLLDSNEAADDGFARQIAGALRPLAKNVKVQIEFNPKRVGHYKLLGFEKHLLKQEDFRNDKVDAAEMAAAEAGVAVYQFEAKPDGEGDVGSVSVRFLDLASGQMIENRWTIPYEADAPRLDQAVPSLRLATSVALLAAKLRGDPLGESVELKTLSELIAGLPVRVREVARVEQLQQMLHQARQISSE